MRLMSMRTNTQLDNVVVYRVHVYTYHCVDSYGQSIHWAGLVLCGKSV